MWIFYFLIKVVLFFYDYIQFDSLLNFVFLLYIFIPLPKNTPYVRAITRLHLAIGVVAALSLLWYESWLPPFERAMNFVTDASTAPSMDYILEFLSRYFSLYSVIIMMLLIALSILIRHHKTLSTALIILIVSGVSMATFNKELPFIQNYVADFYQQEKNRFVEFSKAENEDPGFDIVLLHICSLSWDDLKVVGMQDHDFFDQFDILFTEFNSVTSYSGPSVPRLLRGPCGQTPHGDLYDEADSGCYLLDQLRENQFKSFTAFDHDGQYYDFTQSAMELGHIDLPEILAGIPVRQYSFDGSPIFDGYQVLERWWNKRLLNPNQSAVLYYNSITLHDGSHWVDEENWWKRSRVDGYKTAIMDLFSDLNKFFKLIERTNRNAIIVFVPEHGGALKDTMVQSSGLRDIPLPLITHVPVGFKFIGDLKHGSLKHQRITAASSYQSLAWLLAKFVKNSPFKADTEKLNMSDIPQTKFITDNGEEGKVVKLNNAQFLFNKHKQWVRLPIL